MDENEIGRIIIDGAVMKEGSVRTVNGLDEGR